MEAGGLQEKQDAFIAETGLPFSFLFVIYEGASGNPAQVDDAINYSVTIGEPQFPVLADSEGNLAVITPLTQITHPELCAFTPELEILNCYAGHDKYQEAFKDIREHAGL